MDRTETALSKKIGNRIKEALKIRNMKQIDLCEKINIERGALSNYITGRYSPKQDRLHQIAKVLNVNEAWLMGLDYPMEKEYEIANEKIKLKKEYYDFAREAQEDGIDPEDIKMALDFIKRTRKGGMQF